MKAPKRKKCKVCRGSFEPRNSLHIVCSQDCAIEDMKRKRKAKEAKLAKLDRQQHRERKEKLKTLADYRKEAQQAFNAWVRERDRDLPCASCGRHHQGQYHAGHYRSVGSNPALRYEPLNCHKQCVPCNQHKSGNAIEYRIGLVARIGAEAVAWLEGRHEPKRYSIDDLKAIKAEYQQKLRELKERG